MNKLFALLLPGLAVCANLEAAVIQFREGGLPTAGYTSSVSSIRSDTPAANSGSAVTAVLGNLAGGSDIRVVFAFNLSAIGAAGSATINSVSLTLNYLSDASTSGAITVDLLPLTQTFNEAGVTWAEYSAGNSWTNPGGDFNTGTLLSSASGNPATTGSLSFLSSANFVSAANSAFNSGDQTIYFIGKLNDESGTNRRIFQISSDEFTTNTANRPTLTIDYTAIPEPSAAWLGLVGLGLVTRPRRR